MTPRVDVRQRCSLVSSFACPCWSPFIGLLLLVSSSCFHFHNLPFWIPVRHSKRRSIGRWFPFQPINLFLHLFHESPISLYMPALGLFLIRFRVTIFAVHVMRACDLPKFQQECLNVSFPAEPGEGSRCFTNSTTDIFHSFLDLRGNQDYHYDIIVTCNLAEQGGVR